MKRSNLTVGWMMALVKTNRPGTHPRRRMIGGETGF
jgi:hypothetical protein